MFQLDDFGLVVHNWFLTVWWRSDDFFTEYTWGAFFNSKSELCLRIRIPIPRFITNVKIMILNQANRRSSTIQFETFILYRSHLWNHLKWITTFLFHIKHVSDFQKNLKHNFANKMHPGSGIEPTIYRTRDKRASLYTKDAVSYE